MERLSAADAERVACTLARGRIRSTACHVAQTNTYTVPHSPVRGTLSNVASSHARVPCPYYNILFFESHVRTLEPRRLKLFVLLALLPIRNTVQSQSVLIHYL